MLAPGVFDVLRIYERFARHTSKEISLKGILVILGDMLIRSSPCGHRRVHDSGIAVIHIKRFIRSVTT
jgi:hypothetical protein